MEMAGSYHLGLNRISRGRTVLNRATCLVALIGITLISLAETVVADKPSYPVACRGGGQMYVEFRPLVRPNPRSRGRPVEGLRMYGTVVDIPLRRANYGANQRPPMPGECAWLDRPIRASEPQKLYILVEDAWITGVEIQGPRGVRIKGVWPQESPLNYLLTSIQRGEVFYVHGYADGEIIRVTRVGP